MQNAVKCISNQKIHLTHFSQKSHLICSCTWPFNYWLVQAILAADVGNSVVRAHDVRKFAFSFNWARRADMSHIIKHGFWASVHPFLNNYLTPLEGPLPVCVAAGSRI